MKALYESDESVTLQEIEEIYKMHRQQAERMMHEVGCKMRPRGRRKGRRIKWIS